MKNISTFIFLIAALSSTVCWGAPKKNIKSTKKDNSMELVVVFKKDIEKEVAKDVLTSYKLTFRKGMDSSRGKIYFYSTGPKFIITLTENTDPKIKDILEQRADIHEVYEPDWDIQKD